jgi:protein-tyrosine phosphatase
MVDLHCHILPGIDDGARAMEDSLAMAEAAIAGGITHVVATPHASASFPFEYRRVATLRLELQQKLAGRLQLASGCDFHISPENLAALKADPRPFCINQGDYLLIEFNDFAIPASMDQTLHQLQLAGLRPVITHPERNGVVRTHPERLEKWVATGCFVQVTASSFTGGFGARARACAKAWLDEGLVHFIASDAHNTTSRPVNLRTAFEFVRDRFDDAIAQALFVENPLAAWDARALPFVPGSSGAMPARRKRFFFF